MFNFLQQVFFFSLSIKSLLTKIIIFNKSFCDAARLQKNMLYEGYYDAKIPFPNQEG